MFGTRRSIPFWRPKRRLVNVERALASTQQPDRKDETLSAEEVATTRARGRLAAEARKKARFAEG